ncbi:MAG: MASE1 domain-containing protein [Acidimicrobiia bacterium]
MARGGFVSVGAVVILAVGYFLAGEAGFELVRSRAVIPIWPASGLAVAGLLFFGRRAWPGIAVGAVLFDVRQLSVDAALVSTVAQTAAPLVTLALSGLRPTSESLVRVSDVVRFLAAAAAGPLVSATLASTGLLATDHISTGRWRHVWFNWWIGDTMGILLVVPLVLALAHRRRLGSRPVEAAALLVVAAIGTRLLFGGSLPVVFLVFPFALWAALRHGPGVTAMVNAVVACIAVWATSRGHGPFTGHTTTVRLVVLDAFNAAVAVSSMMLAASVATTARLSAENERLHRRVRSQLADVVASRARIVATTDDERRSLERNLHDGAQQRLIALSYLLGLQAARLPADTDSELRATLTQAQHEITSTLEDLRGLAQIVHPPLLASLGLGPAVESLADQSTVPVEVEAYTGRYPPVVEAVAYLVVREALENVARHAGATTARVRVDETDGRLVVEVSDDGIGGADVSRGSGLLDLTDRVSALDGAMRVESSPGRGTCVRAELPTDRLPV